MCDWFFHSTASRFMKILFVFIHIVLLGWFSWRYWKAQNMLKQFFWPALGAKLFAGVCVGLLYTCYYKVGDTFLYFHDGSMLADLARRDFTAYMRFIVKSEGAITGTFNEDSPRALLFVKIVSLFSLLSFDNYWIIASYFSLSSFLGSWFLVQRISDHFPEFNLSAVVAFLFFPSTVFWSSGLIKESLALASLFFLAGTFLDWWFQCNFSIVRWLSVIFASWVMWALKYYIGAVFFPIVLTALFYKFILSRFLKRHNDWISFFAAMLIFIVLVTVASFSKPNIYPQRLLNRIVDNNNAYTTISAPEDLIHFYELTPTAGNLLLNAPWALFSGLFRPFVWESGNVLQLLVSIENLLLLALSCIALYGIRNLLRSPYWILIFCTLSYIAALCIFITLSTPNFGTLARYRVGYLTFFIFLLCCDKRITRFLQRSFNYLVRNKR
jgi:hypothetical protein